MQPIVIISWYITTDNERVIIYKARIASSVIDENFRIEKIID